MPQNTQILDKDKILSTTSRRILFDCLLKGMSIKDAAPQAKLDYKYAVNMVAKSGMNTLALQTRAEISKRSEITVEQQQQELYADIQAAKEAGRWGAAMTGRGLLLKSIGGMTGDRPHPDSLTAKALDTAKAEALRAIADEYMARKYLAKPISGSHSPMSAQEPAKHVESSVKEAAIGQAEALAGPTEGEQENPQEAYPLPPKAPPANDGTPPLYNAADFGNGVSDGDL